MKKTSLALALLFSFSAFANSTDSVLGTVRRLITIVGGTNESVKIAQLCKLVRSDLDTGTIATELLGPYASLKRDADGIKKFNALVPSIIVDQFYDLLKDKGGSEFRADGTVGKGSARVGVRVTIGSSRFVITVLNSNNRIVDVEYMSISMIRSKGTNFRREIQAFDTNSASSLPISELVKKLERQGVDKCG